MTKAAPANANPAHHIAVFQETTIRRTWHNAEWWFSVVDVCAILTESPDAGAYWRKLKQRLNAEGNQPVTFCHGLKLAAPDGKQRETDCANTGGPVSHHPVHPVAQGGAVQALVGASGL